MLQGASLGQSHSNAGSLRVCKVKDRILGWEIQIITVDFIIYLLSSPYWAF